MVSISTLHVSIDGLLSQKEGRLPNGGTRASCVTKILLSTSGLAEISLLWQGQSEAQDDIPRRWGAPSISYLRSMLKILSLAQEAENIDLTSSVVSCIVDWTKTCKHKTVVFVLQKQFREVYLESWEKLGLYDNLWITVFLFKDEHAIDIDFLMGRSVRLYWELSATSRFQTSWYRWLVSLSPS